MVPWRMILEPQTEMSIVPDVILDFRSIFVIQRVVVPFSEGICRVLFRTKQ